MVGVARSSSVLVVLAWPERLQVLSQPQAPTGRKNFTWANRQTWTSNLLPHQRRKQKSKNQSPTHPSIMSSSRLVTRLSCCPLLAPSSSPTPQAGKLCESTGVLGWRRLLRLLPPHPSPLTRPSATILACRQPRPLPVDRILASHTSRQSSSLPVFADLQAASHRLQAERQLAVEAAYTRLYT